MRSIIATLILSSLYVSLHAQTVINVTDYGVTPNSFVDATEGVKKAIADCNNKTDIKLIFPEGRYDFWPEKAEKREYFISNTSSEAECPSKIKNIGLLFENLSNLTIEGNNSLFVFHGKTISFALDQCENITIQNIRFDYERPTMSELTFTEVHSDHVIASVHPDSRYDIINEKLYFYGQNWTMDTSFSILTDTIEGTWLYSSFQPLIESKATSMDNNKIRFKGDFTNTNYKAGKTLTIRDPYRDHVGAFINLSRNIRLKNITMHYMHGLGIVSQFSENLTYSDIKIIPSGKRSIASFADGMHFSGCNGEILVENSHFKGLHDDPINVHGTYLKITDIKSPHEIIVRFMHDQTYGFPAFFGNDTVGLVRSKSLQTIEKNRVESSQLLSEREMYIKLCNPLSKNIQIGDCLENLTWTPSLTIRNCRFEMTNTRGILITTPRKVLVENNHFYRTGMYAIQIAGDAESWYESGAVNDITIRNNIFEECGYNRTNTDSYSIAINPEDHEIVKRHWVHRNINITQNSFKVSDGLVLKARSTNGLTFKDNLIEAGSWIPPLRNPEVTETIPAFKLENCTNVIIQDNQWLLKEPISIECSQMKKKDLKFVQRDSISLSCHFTSF